MRGQATALLFFLLLTVPISFAIDDLCATCDQVVLQPTVSGSIITVQATHISLKYYNQLQHLQKQSDYQDLSKINIPPDVVAKAFDSQLEPLKDAPLHFKLEDAPLVDSSNAVACDPVNTNAEGVAVCDVKFYRNADGKAEETSKLSRCKTLLITYDGYSNGITYKPSMAQVVLCGENNNALAQIGKDITNEIDNRRNDCVPVFILLGILLAAMYYSGKNPLSLFDITTPRLPATRKFRMAKTGVMVGFTEKGLMNTAIMNKARDALAGTIAASLASQKLKDGKKLTANDRREIKKTVKDILDGKGKYSGLKTPAEKSEAFAKFIEVKFGEGKKAEQATRAVQELLALWAIADEDKKKAGFARGGYNADVAKHVEDEMRRLSGDHAFVRGSRAGKRITEFATGTITAKGRTYRFLPSFANFTNVPIIKQTLGNAMIATAQNLNVWAAMRRAKREAAGSVVGNIARKSGVTKNTPVLGRMLGKTIDKYDPRNKKLSTFMDPVYKLARDAVDTQHALSEEQVREILARTLATDEKNLSELAVWTRDQKTNRLILAINKEAADHLKSLADQEKMHVLAETLAILNQLNKYHSEAEKYNYNESLARIAALAKEINGRETFSKSEIGVYAGRLAAINELGHGLYVLDAAGNSVHDTDGKLIPIISTKEHLFTTGADATAFKSELAAHSLVSDFAKFDVSKATRLENGKSVSFSAGDKLYHVSKSDDKLNVLVEHTKSTHFIDPKVVRDATEKIRAHIERDIESADFHTQVGASMYYNLLENIAMGSHASETEMQSAQLWLLTILRRTAGFQEDVQEQRFANKADFDKRVKLIEKIQELAKQVQDGDFLGKTKGRDGEAFRDKLRGVLSEDSEIKKLMFRIDHDHLEMCLDTLRRRDIMDSFIKKDTCIKLREAETKKNSENSIMRLLDMEYQHEVATRQFSSKIFGYAEKIAAMKADDPERITKAERLAVVMRTVSDPEYVKTDEAKKKAKDHQIVSRDIGDFKFAAEEFRPMRMAFERIIGKMESKFSDES
ncbi:Uncharacterised protein [Candidatus Anstonella stagnisolia]|nr:Uncharacterised protein [Candidatus Anstonella stagnisolia]